MSTTYSHAGVSKLDGEFKVRFANDALRTKVLQKNGHSHIDIVELKNPMTKLDAVAYLLSIDFDNGNKEVRAALEQALDKRSPVEKAPKAKTTVKPTIESIKAKAKVATKAAPKTAAEILNDPALQDAPM
jgi:hypothetical protein